MNANLIYANFSNGYPPLSQEEEIKVTPETWPEPAYKRQSIKVTVTGESEARPKVVWTQGDGEIWSATRNEGTQRVTTTTHWNETGRIGSPLAGDPVIDKINTSQYAPNTMRDKEGNPFQQEYIKDLGIEDISYVPDNTYTPANAKPEFQKGDIFAIISTITGWNHAESSRVDYGDRPDSKDKYQVSYNTPLTIKYSGYVTERKELEVSEDKTLNVGDRESLKAKVKTTQYDGSESSWVDVSYRENTEWSSNSQSVVTVDDSGRITAIGEGTARITAKWKNDTNGPYHLYDYATVTVGEDPDNETEQPGGQAACTYTINPPSQGSTPTTIFMDPGAQGHILADDDANGMHFDATIGIPTSEHLYANAWAYHYLYQHTFGQQRGTITYDCNAVVTYVLKWEEAQDPVPDEEGNMVEVPPEPMSVSETVNYDFSFERNYSYWTVNNLAVYGINQATMSNYALPGKTVTLSPNGYTLPSVSLERSENVEEHVIPKDSGDISYTPDVVDGGDSKPSPPDDTSTLLGLAEAQTGPPNVKNDSLDFTWKGTTTNVMDGGTVSQDGPNPTQIPQAPKIRSHKDSGETILYEDQLLISQSLLNEADNPSSGTIDYTLIQPAVGGGGTQSFPINPINDVTVHTPVVNYSLVSDDQAHNQKTKPNNDRAALILERPFSVRIPTEGQHTSYPGYGDRNYAKYYRIKQVKFPFDVFSQDKSHFYPQGTWINVPVAQLDTTFYLPVWVDEGDYQVEFRNIAENAPSNYNAQDEPDANLNLVHHIASDEVSVEVIGRLYDFRITDIADYSWENVFRTTEGSSPTGVSYWVGTLGIDGDPRGIEERFTTPIRPGSHPIEGHRNVAIKTGYHFKFDFKTKGNMFGPEDGIRITPSFYFVTKDGQNRVPVDLYYHTKEQNFVQIGSDEDQVQRYVILNERLRNVPAVQLEDTARYKYYHDGSIHTEMITENAYQNYYQTVSTKMKTPVGGWDLLMLPEQLRTFIGPKTNIPTSASSDVLRANASIQQWYGEYSLPAEPYVVKQGTNIAEYARTNGGLDKNSPLFLTDGYIIVNFNLESIQAGKVGDPYLQYIHAPLMNQWEMEGYQNRVFDAYGHAFTLLDGDVVFYHADRSSRDDFSPQVPH
ncbi:DUF5704 domain-containing protein [Paenibacillus sp. MER 78]|nr:DUF5704 domain-containing protein [Paenibacillus sp. MER 78]